MTYDSECWAVKTKGGNKLDSGEMRMLRWARGKTILFLVDYIRHYNIRKVPHIKHIKLFLENRFGHYSKREDICAKSL